MNILFGDFQYVGRISLSNVISTAFTDQCLTFSFREWKSCKEIRVFCVNATIYKYYQTTLGFQVSLSYQTKQYEVGRSLLCSFGDDKSHSLACSYVVHHCIKGRVAVCSQELVCVCCSAQQNCTQLIHVLRIIVTITKNTYYFTADK